MMYVAKRSRSSNFSKEEQLLLLNEIAKYKHVIDNKGTNKSWLSQKSIHLKAHAWQKIAETFNEKNHQHRRVDQLQSKYDNLKTDAKRFISRHSFEGAIDVESIDPVMRVVLQLINPKHMAGVKLDGELDLDQDNGLMMDCPDGADGKMTDAFPERVDFSNDSSFLDIANKKAVEITPIITTPRKESVRVKSSADLCIKAEETTVEPDIDVPPITVSPPLPNDRFLEPNPLKRCSSPEQEYHRKRCQLLELEISAIKNRIQFEEEEHRKKMVLLNLEIELKRKQFNHECNNNKIVRL